MSYKVNNTVMQLVSREILIKLLKSSGKISEDEKNTFSYDDFLNEYESLYRKYRRISEKSSIVLNVKQDLDKNYLCKKSPPIQFIGSGSSRTAYACNSGICLKIAYTDSGIAQNVQELKNMNSKYSCFPIIYSYDKKHKASILTECCSHIEEDDFFNILGLKKYSDSIVLFLKTLVSNDFNMTAVQKELNSELINTRKSYQDSNYSFVLETIEELEEAITTILPSIQNQKGIIWECLKDIISFYKQNGKKSMIVDELGSSENWGLAIRNNRLMPIIIDAGFSDYVMNKYY